MLGRKTNAADLHHQNASTPSANSRVKSVLRPCLSCKWGGCLSCMYVCEKALDQAHYCAGMDWLPKGGRCMSAQQAVCIHLVCNTAERHVAQAHCYSHHTRRH